MTSLAIIIPVKNDAKRLAHCLKSIADNGTTADVLQIIVADNGSSDDSPQVASVAGARVLALPGLRVSQLRNAAAKETGAGLLAFVDADHELAPTWIARALEVMALDRVGAAGATCSAPEGGTWVQKMYDALRGRTAGRSEVNWLGAGNMVVRQDAFWQVRGFDESLEACEDVDLCQRLRSAGWRIVADEGLGSVHFGDPPTLAKLFRAERWRGRDNLRVSLRGPMTVRDLPSIVVPILTMAAFITIIASSAGRLIGVSPWRIAGTAAALIAGLAGLRALRMALRASTASPVFFAQAFAVAMTYDLARGIALVTRAPHHRR